MATIARILPIQSSFIRQVTYSPQSEVLLVEFPNGTYRYRGVPEALVSAWELAPSAGGFFNREIKPLFEGELQ